MEVIFHHLMLLLGEGESESPLEEEDPSGRGSMAEGAARKRCSKLEHANGKHCFQAIM